MDNYKSPLKRNPLANINPPTSSSSTTHHGTSKSKHSEGSYDPYAHMKAQQPTGKRVEKLRFDLTLLFKDGKEFCIQEARAASIGLLGKKWAMPPPPPPSAITSTTSSTAAGAPGRVMKVDFNDDGHKASTRNLTMNMNMTMALSGEPTVTINTKEALKDVFGMYNSPERTSSLGVGGKHAPVKRIESIGKRLASMTPAPTVQPAVVDENAHRMPGMFSSFRVVEIVVLSMGDSF